MNVLVISMESRFKNIKKTLDNNNITFERIIAVDGIKGTHPLMNIYNDKEFTLNYRRHAAPGEIGSSNFLEFRLILFISLAYSHSSAPLRHSYINPIVRMLRKITIDQKPKAPISPREIAHGNKNATSRSKIINKMATR